MPRPGGEADKLGNRYEALWTVDAALDLLDSEYIDLTIEAVGDEAAGVEFVRTTRSGVREYHSIKRQRSGSAWTVGSLTPSGGTGRSILGDIIGKTSSASIGVFSSGTSASDLEELIDRARQSDSCEDFEQRLGTSKQLLRQFHERVVPICGDKRAAWTALQRLRVRTKNEPELIKDVERRARSMFRTSNGRRLDARTVRLQIAEFLTESLSQRVTAKSVLDTLKEHGILRSQLEGARSSVGERIRKLNRAHLRRRAGHS